MVLAQFIPLCAAAHVGVLPRVAEVLTPIGPQWVTFIFSCKGNKGKTRSANMEIVVFKFPCALGFWFFSPNVLVLFGVLVPYRSISHTLVFRNVHRESKGLVDDNPCIWPQKMSRGRGSVCTRVVRHLPIPLTPTSSRSEGRMWDGRVLGDPMRVAE